MRFVHFCIDRPIFSAVLSILIVLIGLAGFATLPVAQYPEIVPPTVIVRAQYPGTSAEVISNTVATPIEQEVNGVENMLYMSSQATGDGQLTITVTFALGTDLDEAQVLVQNRVAVAEPRLPEEVRRLGVTVRKSSPDMLMVVHLFSPDGSRDQLYISNYATLQVRDVLARLNGVGDVRVIGARDYAMVIWLDPDKVAARSMTAGEVVAALRAQNVQVAAGVVNQPPVPQQGAFQLNVETLGRLSDAQQFENVIVKETADGRVTRVRDIGRVELTAQSYNAVNLLDLKPVIALQVLQLPGSNALETAERVKVAMSELSRNFPPGLEHAIIFNPTEFIAQSVEAVYETIYEAIALVVIVVILFLQSWRAAIIPILAIPISLIGTFAVMATLGYSLNNLSLFGLVLAIGIVVDDAIVVVENMERHLRAGIPPREAAHRAMDEVGGALIAIALVLCAVFIPAAMIPGISGQFFRQFAVTIASATVISAFVSLTLSPALCAILIKPHDAQSDAGRDNLFARALAVFFRGFNAGFDRLSSGYGRLVRSLLRASALALLVYVGLVGLAGWQFSRAPTGFIPQQDQGYFLNVVQLPAGSSLARTEAVMRQASARLKDTKGIAHVVSVAGFDGATSTTASNTGVIFAILAPFDERSAQGLSSEQIIASLGERFADIQEARILPIMPPAVRGMGSAGGFKMMIQDRAGGTPRELEAIVQQVIAAASQAPELTRVFTLFNTQTPKLYADIDRVKAEMLGVPVERVFEMLEVYLGSSYVNDFNFLGRTFQVRAQADGGFRTDPSAIENFKTRSNSGEMVPLSAVGSFMEMSGPYRVPRYNLYPSVEVQGATSPGISSGTALATMERIASQVLPSGYSFEWTELALQEKLAGNTGLVVFAASIVFVFLLLAAQYESWTLPLSVILIVPMCLLAAVSGLLGLSMNVNILAQIGFVVLVGLAAKNAILIVEFARQAEGAGANRFDAVIQAARIRLRPILMTSFAFILGVVPLVTATGAGAEMRQSLGTAVFFGMIGVTFFGLMFTPVFYAVCRALEGIAGRYRKHVSAHTQ